MSAAAFWRNKVMRWTEQLRECERLLDAWEVMDKPQAERDELRDMVKTYKGWIADADARLQPRVVA